MTAPLILIVGRELTESTGLRTSGFGAGDRYQRAIVRAGGVPLILPPLIDMIDDVGSVVARCDGVVLHGGGDVDPSLYGQVSTTEHIYGVNAAHDRVECAVVQEVLARSKPMLAICRGAQVLNVVCGGTLIQHLSLPGHRERAHPVSLTPESRVARAMGTIRPEACFSFHHQAVDDLGNDLVITGRSDDGVVEAIETTGTGWIVGVQWHPEDTADTDPLQQRLFTGLIGAIG